MTPSNLRVLRSEQSSGSLKELAKQKDHLKHVVSAQVLCDVEALTPARQSPLSMTGDRPGVSKKLKRKTSSLRILSSEEQRSETNMRRSKSAVRTPVTTRSFFRPRSSTNYDTDRSESDEDEDATDRRPEDTPLQERVKDDYFTPHSPVINLQQRSLSIDDHEQGILSAELAAANDQAIPSSSKLGTRVTMASRTGYFTDRIISPTMVSYSLFRIPFPLSDTIQMRSMALLYIGPHHDPDFATDYRISPVLAPAHLLAQFPPLLMQCGEKDPFVDDTVVFAGRVREAKRARKVELDLALSGKSARFGESLRISGADAPTDIRKITMKRERDRLAQETEDDWAQIVIFSEWSHGYLQMPLIMPEAYAVCDMFFCS